MGTVLLTRVAGATHPVYELLREELIWAFGCRGLESTEAEQRQRHGGWESS